MREEEDNGSFWLGLFKKLVARSKLARKKLEKSSLETSSSSNKPSRLGSVCKRAEFEPSVDLTEEARDTVEEMLDAEESDEDLSKRKSRSELYLENEVDSRVKEVIDKLKALFEKYSKAFLEARSANCSSTNTSSADSNIHARHDDDFYAFLKS
ncbi:hypothetical protein QVD17_20007 [Tagetes erecta]|uniref:Uncharacterized protein n=1 Tax=Tagetes erecta TaxID=13708 RepID=A0AAD8KNC8_TARER|nr:hypothetical protein QVD17_20007 [Tagetes erecta]